MWEIIIITAPPAPLAQMEPVPQITTAARISAVMEVVGMIFVICGVTDPILAQSMTIARV